MNQVQYKTLITLEIHQNADCISSM